MDLFVSTLWSDPFFYFAVVLTVVISITLHELAHGFMAIKLGDHTPIAQGRMTGNPLVHMGPFSIFACMVLGIAWGAMPVDPTRLRGRFGEAKVAVAGPAMNFLLAIIALTGLGLWEGFREIDPEVSMQVNGYRFLMVFGSYNILLGVFNLFPVPPLDGSHILANFYRPYADAISDPSKGGLWMLGFILVFSAVPIVAGPLTRAGFMYKDQIATLIQSATG